MHREGREERRMKKRKRKRERQRVPLKQNKYIKVYASNCCKSFGWKENEKLMMTGGKLRRRRRRRRKRNFASGEKG